MRTGFAIALVIVAVGAYPRAGVPIVAGYLCWRLVRKVFRYVREM